MSALSPERWREALSLAERALEQGPSTRTRWVAGHCHGDAELAEAVAGLLAADAAADPRLSPPGPGEGPARLVERATVLLPGQRLDGFVIEGLLDRGGMGTVYTARQERPSRRVAIKVLGQGFRSAWVQRRFAFELQALGRLDHAAVAAILGHGEHVDAEGRALPWLALELVEGARPITTYAREEHLVLSRRVALFRRACEAVEHGHRQGVLHRDLKPGNVLVDRVGRVKVIDFGIARALDQQPSLTTLAQEAGHILGTLGYVSPEQLTGDPGTLDARSDVYALGAILYELVCERPLYDLADMPLYQAVRTVRDEAPAPPRVVRPELPEALEAVVLRALARGRARRWASAAALSDALRKALGDGMAGAP